MYTTYYNILNTVYISFCGIFKTQVSRMFLHWCCIIVQHYTLHVMQPVKIFSSLHNFGSVNFSTPPLLYMP